MTTAAAVRSGERRVLLTGGAIYMASAALVNAGNYAFNVVLGRRLGPAAFAELSFIVTLLLVASFGAATLQTTAARYVAVAADEPARHRVERWLVRAVRPAGLAAAGLMVVAAPALAGTFRLSSPLPLVLFAAGLPVYLAQAVRRGAVQGRERFGKLAVSFQAEMWVRLLGGIGLVALGWSVTGATVALVLSVAASWFIVYRPLADRGMPPIMLRREVTAFGRRTALLLAGEILVSHSDLIIAKLAFEPVTAGSYAALSLIGRIAFLGTWPVVALVVPVVARRHRDGHSTRALLGGALGLVGGVSVVLGVAAFVAPGELLARALGPGFLAGAPWLWVYVLATGCFAVANTLFAYHLARGVTTGAGLVLGGGLAQVAVLAILHGSIAVMVVAQLVLMAALLVVAVGWHVAVGRSGR